MIDGGKIKADRKAKGWSQKRLTEEAGIRSYQLIGQLERGENSTSKLIHRIAAALGRPTSHYDPEVSGVQKQVPILGLGGADNKNGYYATGDGGDNYVNAPDFDHENTSAVEVSGDSLGEVFDGWLAFYDEVHAPPVDGQLGRLCVVWLEDDRVLIKELAKGPQPGLYNLYSQGGARIENVTVIAAAMVKAMGPR